MDVNMGQIIIIAAAVAFVVRLDFSHQERQRRLEVVHRERMAAIEKGIPLPELPLEPVGLATIACRRCLSLARTLVGA
jgi:hypothetical protein